MDISNREIASALWLSLFLIWAICSPKHTDVRESTKDVIKNFFSKTILTILFLFSLYLSIMIGMLAIFNLWDPSLLKDTIFWALISFGCLFKLNDNNNFETKIKIIALRCFTLSFVIEYIANMFSFNLLSEIIITPIMTIILLMSIVVDYKDEHAILRKPLNFIICLYGLIIAIFTTYELIFNNQNINIFFEVKKFLLPFTLTILYVPFPYIFFLYCKYEAMYGLFLWKLKDKKLARKAIIKIFLKFKFNLFQLDKWHTDMELFNIKNIKDIDTAIDQYFHE